MHLLTSIRSGFGLFIAGVVAVAALSVPNAASAAVSIPVQLKTAIDIEHGVALSNADLEVAGVSVTAVLNGVTTTGTTASDGSVTLASSATPSAGDVMVVYINDNATYSGVALTKLSTDNPASETALYANSVILTSNVSGQGITAAEIATKLTGFADTDVTNYVSATSSSVTTTAAITALTGNNGGVVALNGDLTVSGDLFIVSEANFGNYNVTAGEDIGYAGNLTLGSGTMSFGSSLFLILFGPAPTFTAGTSTVQCTGVSCAFYDERTFYNLSVIDSTDNDVAQTVSFEAGSTQTITNLLYLKGLRNERLTVNTTTAGVTSGLTFTDAATLEARNIAMRDISLTDSSSQLATPIDPCGSINTGNTTNWFTGGAGTTTDACADELTSSFTVAQRINAPKIVRGAYRVLLNKHVEYEVFIRNTGETTLTTIPLETRYSTNWLKFVSASKTTVNTTNDGQLNWTNVAPEGGLLPGKSTTVKVKYKVVKRSLFPTQRILGHEVRVKGVVDSLSDTLAMVKGKNKSVIVR